MNSCDWLRAMFTGCTNWCLVLCQTAELNAAGTRPSLAVVTVQSLWGRVKCNKMSEMWSLKQLHCLEAGFACLIFAFASVVLCLGLASVSTCLPWLGLQFLPRLGLRTYVLFCRELATSAPSERIFSHGRLFIRPHCARLGNKLLCQLMVTNVDGLLA